MISKQSNCSSALLITFKLTLFFFVASPINGLSQDITFESALSVPGQPYGIAIDNFSSTYVTFLGSNTIIKYNAQDDEVLRFNTSITGTARGIAVSDAGAIFVALQNERKIEVFDPNGNFRFDFTTFDANRDARRPVGLHISADQKLYVGAGRQLLVYDLNGNLIDSRRGFFFLVNIWTSDNNEIYTLDEGGIRGENLKVFDSSLTFLRQFHNGFGVPQGITGDNCGNIYVSGQTENKVTVFTPTGNVIKEFRSIFPGDPERIRFPTQIEVNNFDGTLSMGVPLLSSVRKYSITEFCNVLDDPQSIPTLSQWAIVILSLLLSCLAIVYLINYKHETLNTS